jgi:D-alanine-D-alanine ligase
MTQTIHVAIVYNEPSPTVWEKEKIAVGCLNLQSRNGRELEEGIELAAVKILEEVRLEIDGVRRALLRFEKEVSVVAVNSDLRTLFNTLDRLRPDVVFNFCESLQGESLEEVYLASLFELLGLRYTGSSPFVLGLAAHKNLVKDILRSHGVPTSKSWLIKEGMDLPRIDQSEFPLIVKPHCQDASVGIDNEAVVQEYEQLEKRVKYVFDTFNESALVERFIDGREFNVSIMGNNPPEVLPLSEIDFSEMPPELHKIVSYEAKWVEGSDSYGKTKPICPADVSPVLCRKIEAIALKAYEVIGCRDYARIDMRLDRHGVPYIVEVNPNPDISADAGFVRSARVYGMDHQELLNRIIDIALAR